MSKREDILDISRFGSEKVIRHGLVYSEILGWIDMGHARGDDVRALMASFSTGESNGKPYYQVRYEQKMAFSRFATGRFNVWQIKKGRTPAERRSIALAMMMSTAVAFENWQSMPFFSWYTDSGFSGEDLISDLFGFYRVNFPRIYWGELKIVCKESALRRWDHYGPIGRYKNTGFLPLLFPDPAEKFTCHKPYKGQLPRFMMQVTPYKFTPNEDIVIRTSNKSGIINSIE
ncbi:hypothetical protein [Serratia plymuthica]|uniref:DUF4056 domain-containing protein n=1 Tax=Serratia plymuthica TaxID=82996 RepID=A0A2X4UKC2_SERPL|nr:hypothetical protein [Serratia plymuthica]QPS20781.1 hypothetical protein I6G64_25075 [Serratia plymuthica]QPS62394.1 hypothetical protein I6G52_20335 [Serratia plymuthica]RKS65316.1 hypothetical protein C8E17_4674 [Serratia plymuthica]CAI2435286.1 Uncharacterised protein [Serratia plymuthica]SQI40357.1 Uncharacterised protein [Serratia plymuthica]